MATQGKKHELILKQSGTNLILIREHVRTLAEARTILQRITTAVEAVNAETTTQPATV
jgi:hypothetical protein